MADSEDVRYHKTAAATPTEAPTVHSISIRRLFGRTNLKVTLHENRRILVGENGSGKSTVLNILYQVLTKQWTKLASMPFESLKLEIKNTTIEVSRASIKSFPKAELRRAISYELRAKFGPLPRYAMDELLSLEPHAENYQQEIELFARRFGLPFVRLLEVLDPYLSSENAADNGYVMELNASIDSLVNSQILFLPTYRRIERDLQSLFPSMHLDRDLRRRRVIHDPLRRDQYVELVEFGMQDVEELFEIATQRLDREFRAELNRLTGEYLRDTIRSDYKPEADEGLLADDAPLIVADVLERIDERTLPGPERTSLAEIVGNYQKSREAKGDQRVVLHFVSKLIKMHGVQRRREESVTNLVNVCNRYLSGKSLQFDPTQFDLHLSLEGKAEESGQKLSLSGLSSGEKQIVSLFTHLFLSNHSSYFVLIDEPELSISVPWQRRFLEDIVQTGLCSGLVAVTHSPFIFENSLASYARSMLEFVQPG